MNRNEFVNNVNVKLSKITYKCEFRIFYINGS